MKVITESEIGKKAYFKFINGTVLVEILNDEKFIHKIRFFQDHKELNVSELKKLEIIKSQLVNMKDILETPIVKIAEHYFHLESQPRNLTMTGIVVLLQKRQPVRKKEA